MAVSTDTGDLCDTVTVIYASQTGNAESIATHLHQECVAKGFKSGGLSSFDGLEKAALPAGSTALIIVTSTTGDGDPPDNSFKFGRWLRRIKPEEAALRVKGRKFTILGLGDTNYTNFNQPAKKLEKRLLELGGVAFYPKGLADDGTGLELVVDPWIEGLWPVLESVAVKSDSTAASAESVKDEISTETTDVLSTTFKSTLTLSELDVPFTEAFDTYLNVMIPDHLRVRPVNLDSVFPDSLPPIADLKKVPDVALNPFTWVPEPSPATYSIDTAVISAKTTPSSFTPSAPGTQPPNFFSPTSRPIPEIPLTSAPYTSTSPYAARIVSSRTITSNNPRTHELTMDIRTLSTPSHPYTPVPGDALGIHAPVHDIHITQLVKLLHWSPTSLLLRGTFTNPPSFIPSTQTTLYHTLRTLLDLTPPLRKPFLRVLADHVTDPLERHRLLYLVSSDGAAAFKTLKTRIHGIAEILATLAISVEGLTFERVVEACGGAVTRFYSIAWRYPSSATKFISDTKCVYEDVSQGVGYVSLVCSVVDGMESGKYVRGLATPFLESGGDAGVVQVFPKPPSMTFRLDDKVFDVKRWVIVANGTGLAPFLGMLQELEGRESRGRVEEVWVFHGRRWEEESGYVEWVKERVGGKVVGRVVEAVSRPVEGSGVYVQHRVAELGSEVWRMVKDGDAGVYVCGSVAMAKDLHMTLCEVVVKEGSVDAAAAKVFWTELEQKGRYMKDVWG